MRCLLDTHALLWWLEGNERLSLPARAAMTEPTAEILVSAATVWEIATKVRIGRLPGAAFLVNDLRGVLASQGFKPLPITLDHAERAGSMAGEHQDPFDRVLIAQAWIEDCVLVSNERLFDRFGVRRCW